MNFKILALGVILALTACTQPVTVTSKESRLDYLTNMNNWQAKGRVAISDAEENHTASIVWRQKNEHFDILLSNPLASQTLHVTSDNIEETYLYDLPADDMRYWLKGMPSPISPIQKVEYDSHYQLKTLQQNGWSIDYLSYSPNPPIQLPEKIVAHKDEINIKIIINCWNK